MLTRSTLPQRKPGHPILGALLRRRWNPGPSTLFVVARIGDELLMAGGALMDLPGARFLSATDGFRENLADSGDNCFVDRSDCARALRREYLNALAHAGWSAPQFTLLEFTTGEISGKLPILAARLAAAFRELQPETVITHPCEGIDPAQDSIAFAVQAACDLLERDGRPAPVRIEAAGIPGANGHSATGQFLAPSATESMSVQLDAERQAFKRRLLDSVPILRPRLRCASLERESFRIAPRYDFQAAPPLGELTPDPDAGCGRALARRWRRATSHALRALGLASE